MNVRPSSSFEAVADLATTSLTPGVRVIDNAGATTIARTTSGIIEYPAGSGIYTTTLTSPSVLGQYTILWDTGVEAPGSFASEDLVVTNDAPETGVEETYEAVVDWGMTGATIGMRVVDNEGATVVPRVTGFTEYPAGSGVYYRGGNIRPTAIGQYTLIFDDDGGTAAVGHVATEELIVTLETPVGDTYTTVDELARILKIRAPSDEQIVAMTRVLLMAAGEIDREIDLAEDASLSGWELSLVAQVNLQRAAELWFMQEVPLGLAGIGSEFGTTHLARNSWDKYAYTLAPLKGQWGFA